MAAVIMTCLNRVGRVYSGVVTKPPSGLSATVVRRLNDGLVLLAILLLPLLGVLWSGRDYDRIFQFPPKLDIPTHYLYFSWMAIAAVMLAVLTLVAPWFFRRGMMASGLQSATWNRIASVTHKFPWWGWFALGWTLGWWALAWHRWTWFAEIQRFTFFPLWIGFILVVHGLTQRRTGQCLLRNKPGQWVALFGLSAVFWWIFEWLNRFAGNWHYLGVDDFGAWSYALHATLCFSTVLPAVAGVAEWLGSHPTWLDATSRGPVWSWLLARCTGPLLLWGGVGALVGTGRWPSLFYPALWIAPLALSLGLNLWRGQSALACEMARGDWRRAATWMVAALVCGFFWEMWNVHSLAHWVYTVPGVERWHIFEMPAAGYTGYLPFGLACLLVVERVLPMAPKTASSV